MRRIQDPTAVTSAPAVPTTTGPTGFFTNGDPGTQAATVVPDWWLNMMQEEFAAFLTRAGFALDGTKRVIDATDALYTGGRLLRITDMAANGTFTSLAATKSILVEGVGAGGGGAGCGATAAGSYSAGGCGGSGSYSRKLLTTGFSGGVAVVCAVGGATTVGGNGGDAADSNFGGLVYFRGGKGGQITGSTTGSAKGQGGQGGIALAGDGDFYQNGISGSSNYASSAALNTSGGPVAQIGGGSYGFGGVGAADGPSSSAAAGGAGGPALIRIYEFG